MRGTTIAAVALLVLAGSSAADAVDKSVLVLPVEHDGLDPNVVKNLDRLARERVEKVFASHRLLPAPALGVPDLLVAAGCSKPSAACLATIGRTVGATQVIRVQARGAPEKIRLEVQRVRVSSQKGKTYKHTIDDLTPEALPIFAWHVETAVGGRPAPLTGQIALLTEGEFGSLDGAELLLDDQRATPKDLETLAPGEHHLVVMQRGFESVHWRGFVEGGRTVTVRVKFEPVQPPPVAAAPPPEAPPPAAIVGVTPEESDDGLKVTWVFGVATGLSAVAAGAIGLSVLVTESEVEEQQIDCFPDDGSTPQGICEGGFFRRDLANGLWITTGALAVMTAVAFFIEVPDGSEPETAVSVGFLPTPDGAAASMSLTF